MVKNKFKPNYQLKAKVQACLSKNFLRIPKSICGIKVLSSTKLNLPEKIILSEIVSFQAQGRISTIGIRFILNEFNIPSGTASRAIDTLLGHRSKKDKKLGIKRPKILVTKPIYWNNKKKSVKARELLINPNLIDNFINSHPNILNKYLLSRHIPKKERMQKVNFVRKLLKNKISQSKTPSFHGGTPTSAYSSSSSSKMNNKAFQSGIPLFHHGTHQFHSGKPPFHDGTHAFHSGTTSFHSGTNKITHKSRDNTTDKNKLSSSSSSGSSELSDEDDDELSFNFESTPKSETESNDGSLHKANSKSHSSLSKVSARANVSEYHNRNVSRKNKKFTTNVETEFVNIIYKKLIAVFPKLKRSKTVKNIINGLIHRYGRDAVQKGVDAVITRSDSVRTPLPYLKTVISNLSSKMAKEKENKEAEDPNIPSGLTPNQWNVLDSQSKLRLIQKMMIQGRNRKGRAYIESFIRCYNLHNGSDDDNFPYSKIERRYIVLLQHFEVYKCDDFGDEFREELNVGSKEALKKQYLMFTSARLRVWTSDDYKLDINDLVEAPSIDFAKEEQKIEEFDSGDTSQLAIDKVVYNKFMKHLADLRAKFKKMDIMDKEQAVIKKQKKQNLKFYHKKFGDKAFNSEKHNIMEVWASHVSNNVMVSIYNQQFKNRSVQKCTADEIFSLLRDGLKKYYPNKLDELKIKNK